MSSNSSSVSRPGLLRMLRGVCSLPTSCSAAAVRTLATSAGGEPHRAGDPLGVAGDALRVAVGAGVARLEQSAEVGQRLDAGPCGVGAEQRSRPAPAGARRPSGAASPTASGRRRRGPATTAGASRSPPPTLAAAQRQHHAERDREREQRSLAPRDEQRHGTAGRTTTKVVAITACGSHRSEPGARRAVVTRTAIGSCIGKFAAVNPNRPAASGHKADQWD